MTVAPRSATVLPSTANASASVPSNVSPSLLVSVETNPPMTIVKGVRSGIVYISTAGAGLGPGAGGAGSSLAESVAAGAVAGAGVAGAGADGYGAGGGGAGCVA